MKSYGNNVLPVGEGQLASGLEGKGRMLEPKEIINSIISYFYPKQSLKNQTVLITAGPTMNLWILFDLLEIIHQVKWDFH